MSIKTLMRISVEESSKTRHYWASRPSINANTTREILTSDVLIVPWENRSGTGDTFPQGTTTFYRRISKELGSSMVVFAVERENYQELSLHADHIRWPTVAVTTVAFGIVAGVIANEITRLIKDPNRQRQWKWNLLWKIHLAFAFSIQYLGPPSRALDTIVTEAKMCFPREIEDDSKEGAETLPDDSHRSVEGE